MDSSQLSLLMFLALFLSLALGMHISFSLYAIALAFAYYLWGFAAMNTVVMAIWGMMNNFVLIAIPLFIFMAMILEKSKLAGDMYDCFYKWSGGLRGGLAIATIVAGAMIGAVSGVVAAGVIGLGVIALPQMAKYRYNRGVSLGSIISGGTLGQIIPPSLAMIVYSAATGLSVGKMFAAGIAVGALLVVLFSTYIFLRSYLDKQFCPPLPLEERVRWREKIISLRVLVLPGLLIVGTVGSILAGIATPTEGAGVGAFGAILFSLVTGRFSVSMLKDCMLQTLKVSSMIAWIIGGAASFSAVFSAIGGNRVISDIAMNMPGGEVGVLITAIAIIFLLGMFLETIAIIMLVAPILTPIIIAVGYDPLWWGIIFMALLQTSFITPPFGLALFYLKGVVPPDIKLADIYSAAVPFIGLQLIAIVIIIIFPVVVLWLPQIIG